MIRTRSALDRGGVPHPFHAYVSREWNGMEWKRNGASSTVTSVTREQPVDKSSHVVAGVVGQVGVGS